MVGAAQEGRAILLADGSHPKQIVGGNKVELYEMALYGSLVAFAQQLGFNDAASLLQQTLNEEKAADAGLTQIAETAINSSAAQERSSGVDLRLFPPRDVITKLVSSPAGRGILRDDQVIFSYARATHFLSSEKSAKPTLITVPDRGGRPGGAVRSSE